MTATPVTNEIPDPRRMQAELSFLSELCQVVASTTEFRQILDWIVDKTTAMLEAEQGSIKLLGNEPAPMLHTMIRKQPQGSSRLDFAIETSVTGWILQRGEPLASADLLADPRFPGLRNAQSRVRSILAAPLKVGNRITGILAVTHRLPSRQWTQYDTQLLTIIARHSADVLEQARLKEIEREKQRLEAEIAIAQQTQLGLVPSKPLIVGPWEVRGRVIPARMVGGDYFDYYALPGERFAVAIADVTGKGLPAAILMSNVQAALRAHGTGQRGANDVVRSVNAQMARSTSPDKFVTMFYGEVDVAGGTISYTSGGHNPPLLRRKNGQIEQLSEGGLILGVLEDFEYQKGVTAFTPGDALLLYSDGIPEATDSRGAFFGEDRLLELWRSCDSAPAQTVLDRIVSEVERFRGSAGQSDDITALIVAPRGEPD